MDRTETQHRAGRNGGFAPVAQNDSDLEAADDDVPQRWTELPLNEPLNEPLVETRDDDFHSHIRSIFRNTIPSRRYEEDQGLHYVASHTVEPSYAPVGNLLAVDDGLEDASIAELPGHIEYYAPGHNLAPSLLSEESDVRTEKITYSGYESKDKYLRFAPQVSTVEVDDDIPSEPPKNLPDYKPAVFKPRFLLILFSAAVALLALMVAALLVLPSSSKPLEPEVTSRNTSEIRVRSYWDTQRDLRHARDLGPRQRNGDSESSSVEVSSSNDDQVATSILTTTAKDPDETTVVPTTTTKLSDKTTTAIETEPSEAKSEPTSIVESPTTTHTLRTSTSTTSTQNQDPTTTTAAEAAPTPTDAQPTKASPGGDGDASPTTLKETTKVTSTHESTITTSSDEPTSTKNDDHTTKNNPEPTDTDHDSGGKTTSTQNDDHTTKNNPEPTGSDHGSGGETTSTKNDHTTKTSPEPTDSDRNSGGKTTRSENEHTRTTITTPTSSQNPDSTGGDAGPTTSTRHAGGGGPNLTDQPTQTTQTSQVDTMTGTSTSQKPPNQEPSPSTATSSTTSDGDFTLPFIPSTDTTTAKNPSQATCTVEVTQTQTQLITVPTVTLDLSLRLVKRLVTSPAPKIRRQEAACDTTTTVTHHTTIVSTVGLVTVTLGIGAGQPAPTISTTNIPGAPDLTTSTTSSALGIPGGPIQTGSSPVEIPTTGINIPPDAGSSSPPDTASPITNTAVLPTDTTAVGALPGTTLQSSEPSQQPGAPSQATTPGNDAGTTPITTTQATGPGGAIPTNPTTQATAPGDTAPTNINSPSPGDPNTNLPPTTTVVPDTPVTTVSGILISPSTATTPVGDAPPQTTMIISQVYTTTNSDKSVITSSYVSTIVIGGTTPVDDGAAPSTAALPGQITGTFQHTITLPTVNTQDTHQDHPDPTANAQAGHTDDKPPEKTSQTTTKMTTIQVVESTSVVYSVRTTVTPTLTPTASVTDDVGLVVLGPAYETTIPVTTVMFAAHMVTTPVDELGNPSGAIQTVATVSQTDENGMITGTVTGTYFDIPTTITEKDTNGWPITTKTLHKLYSPSETTLTDRNGKVFIQTYFTDVTTRTMRNSRGSITGYEYIYVTDSPIVTTLRDAAGNPTRTVTQMMPAGTSTSTSIVTVTPTGTANVSAVNLTTATLPIPSGYYFLGLLLPTLLAIGISIPIRILDQTVKLHQPFSAMTLRYGARPSDSLCLKTNGLWGLVSGFVAPRMGNWLLAVTGILVVANSILIALSTETMEIQIQDGDCVTSGDGSIRTCPTSLVVAEAPSKSAAGLICLMAILIATAAKGLWKRCTGVQDEKPWSMLQISTLAQHEETLTCLNQFDGRYGNICTITAARAFGDREFALRHWRDEKTGWQYGVKMTNDRGPWPNGNDQTSSRISSMPFLTLSLAGRIVFFLSLFGLALMVLLYHNTTGGFQDFMDSGNFGGRFILTTIGVLISLNWWTFFTCESKFPLCRIFKAKHFRCRIPQPLQAHLSKQVHRKSNRSQPTFEPLFGFLASDKRTTS